MDAAATGVSPCVMCWVDLSSVFVVRCSTSAQHATASQGCEWLSVAVPNGCHSASAQCGQASMYHPPSCFAFSAFGGYMGTASALAAPACRHADGLLLVQGSAGCRPGFCNILTSAFSALIGHMVPYECTMCAHDCSGANRAVCCLRAISCL